MRCYLTTAGELVATQAEAGKDWKRVELPDDKGAVLALLNALAHRTEGPWYWLAEGMPIRVNAGTHTVTITPSAPPPIQPPATSATCDAIGLTEVETFIQAADHRQLCSVTENAILRMRELAAEAGR